MPRRRPPNDTGDRFGELGGGLVPPLLGQLRVPGDVEEASTFQMACDGTLVTLTVGGGPWSTAHVQETGAVFVPTATHFSLRDPESGATVYEEHDYKGVPRPASSSCVEEFTFQGLLGSFTVEGDMRP